MSDLKLNGITPSAISLGSSSVQKIYNGSTLVWPVGVSPSGPDPYTPVYGVLNFFATKYVSGISNEIIMYDSSFQEIEPDVPFSILPENRVLVGVSDNYQYMVASSDDNNASESNILISQDYGVNFNAPTSGAFNAWINNVKVSRSGKTILAVDNTSNDISNYIFKISNDYGSTFTQVSLPDVNSVIGITCCSISGDGKYIGLCVRVFNTLGNAVYKSFFSKDYGVSWKDLEEAAGADQNKIFQIIQSTNGEELVFINIQNTNQKIYSIDYATTFQTTSYTSIPTSFFLNNKQSSVSYDNQYYAFGWDGQVIYFGNNGITQQPTSSTPFVSGLASSIFVSNSGEYIFFSGGGSARDYKYSSNYGLNFISGDIGNTSLLAPFLAAEITI